jgi:hypothetical protein
MNFKDLGIYIKKAHKILQIQAGKSVNSFLTARNWLIGLYIVEYQQNGNDRANYGDNLISDLAKEINIKGLSTTNLKLSRQFYITYPQLNQVVSDFLSNQQLELPVNISISQSATDQLQIEPQIFLNNISFTHIVELLKIDEPLKTTFFRNSNY